MIRQADLDDWSQVKAMWIRFSASRFSKRVVGTIETLKKYFYHSLGKEDIRLFVMDVEGVLKGFCIIHEAVSLALNEEGQPNPEKVAFLRILHAEPVEERHSNDMHETLNAWAKSRGCKMMTGHCCMDFPFKAYARLHNIHPLWVVVGKEVV